MGFRPLPWLLLAAGLSIGACGSLTRPMIDTVATPQATREFSSLKRFRFVADNAEQSLAFMQAWDADRKRAGRQRITALAISGGGANGAFGAGVLVGWSRSGTRPEFDLVTGVSTGALIAPLAFAGKYFDQRLISGYRSAGATQLTERGIGMLARPSLYSGEPLAQLIEHYTSPALLHTIADQHKLGRRLLVATTNLDTQETIIWDMGAIAASAQEPGNEQQALALFRTILTASASVPGIFPPVAIADGEASEIHADGGINAPFLLLPEALVQWQINQPSLMPGRIYIIINAPMNPHNSQLNGGAVAIMGRSFDSLSRANLRMHMAMATAFAYRHHVLISYAALPSDMLDADPLNFEATRMARLFDLGTERYTDLSRERLSTVPMAVGEP
ncbi:patatin-like phospholipase family protein [Pseudomonas sp. SZMC_28357]|uniref:patatin-like phospholipase family protein n=1 Tax=Pseudomonas sp. SZMC_28357 TaxID=3074380 RepID=UPI002871CD17|nr:patatin-like phospholipase family protein [Pseudomonas sp. SZMC_28357]MDR9750232.1 patatin-like phospholipase family protein [Pseudomonas sp. SZMC_28357]